MHRAAVPRLRPFLFFFRFRARCFVDFCLLSNDIRFIANKFYNFLLKNMRSIISLRQKAKSLFEKR